MKYLSSNKAGDVCSNSKQEYIDAFGETDIEEYLIKELDKLLIKVFIDCKNKQQGGNIDK